MSVTTEHDFTPRPRSPWTGSRYETRHRWQLDLISSMAEATKELRELAAELTAAHTAGWWLMEPMRSGHLLAARASRLRRAGQALGSSPQIDGTTARFERWWLRVVDEPPGPGEDVLDTRVTDRTPVLAWTGRRVDQVSGPIIALAVLGEVDRHVRPTGLARGSGAWRRRGSDGTLTWSPTAVRCGCTPSRMARWSGSRRLCCSSTQWTAPWICYRLRPHTGASPRLRMR